MTSKELAALLHLSEASVSLALHGRPGVSTATRKRVMTAAEENDYDFSRLQGKQEEDHTIHGTVYCIMFRRHGAVLANTPFFAELCEGIEMACKSFNHRLCIYHMEGTQKIETQLRQIQASGCIGIILLGTEMRAEDLDYFIALKVPLVLLDAYFEKAPFTCVTINNRQGAYLATEYLIQKYGEQPGYLHSSYNIKNFEERGDGFFKVIHEHGMASSRSVVYELAPSAEGALADMLALLDNGEKPQRSYFADNDHIALGAMRALISRGYRIPQDVAIVGFDNGAAAEYSDPPLTTIHVPKDYMGMVAMHRLEDLICGMQAFPTRTEIGTKLIKRQSV